MTDFGPEGARPYLLTRRRAGGQPADVAASELTAGVSRADFSIAESNNETISRVFALSSLVLALAFANLAWQRLPIDLVRMWLMAAAVTSLLPLAVDLARRLRPAPNPGLTTRQVEFMAVLLGATWAMLPALFFGLASPSLRTFSGALLFAISGLGAFAFARASGAAVAFVAMIAGATGLASLNVGGEFGLAFAIASALYGLSLCAMVLIHHLRTRTALKAQAEIHRQKEIIAFLLNDFEDGTTDWLWETGAGFNFTYASPKLARLLGVEPARIAEMGLSDLAGLDAASDNAWPALMAKLLGHHNIHGEELLVRGGLEPRWLRLTARPLFGADGRFLGYRGVGRDITPEKLAYDELLRAKAAAEQADAAKSQFLAVMSHELKTPLNAIVGFSELLTAPQADTLREEARTDHLRTILESSRHLQTLISDILDATRIEKGTMRLAEQDGDAAELLEIAVKMCRDVAEKADCTIIARLPEAIEIHGDITRIKQILINLVTNAVKFSPSQGFVHVGIEPVENGALAFTVRDSGMGIAGGDIERVFEPFAQADRGMARRYGGMGLGLSIARKLARLHGGEVTLESHLGSGTTAKLILPASRVGWPVEPRAATTAA